MSQRDAAHFVLVMYILQAVNDVIVTFVQNKEETHPLSNAVVSVCGACTGQGDNISARGKDRRSADCLGGRNNEHFGGVGRRVPGERLLTN